MQLSPIDLGLRCPCGTTCTISNLQEKSPLFCIDAMASGLKNTLIMVMSDFSLYTPKSQLQPLKTFFQAYPQRTARNVNKPMGIRTCQKISIYMAPQLDSERHTQFFLEQRQIQGLPVRTSYGDRQRAPQGARKQQNDHPIRVRIQIPVSDWLL
jgi:hypothetical protein